MTTPNAKSKAVKKKTALTTKPVEHASAPSEPVPMLDIGSIKVPINSLSQQTRELISIYQEWQQQRLAQIASLEDAAKSLVPMQREVFKFDAAIKSLGDEIAKLATQESTPVAANDPRG